MAKQQKRKVVAVPTPSEVKKVLAYMKQAGKSYMSYDDFSEQDEVLGASSDYAIAEACWVLAGRAEIKVKRLSS